MDKSILFFAKFGERDKLEKLKNGNIYFSNAENFRKIEEEQYIKGQGDKYDGRFNILTMESVIIPNDAPTVEYKLNNVSVSLDFEGNKNKAVFCITAGTKENCSEYDGENHYTIKFKEEQANLIREHFCNADSVLLIKNSACFIENIHDNIGCRTYDNKVLYYSSDHLTVDFMDFISGRNLRNDSLDNKVSQGNIDQDNVYRFLLCKDNFFRLQQEYRFVLFDTLIDKPRSFAINAIENSEIYGLDDFFSGISVNL